MDWDTESYEPGIRAPWDDEPEEDREKYRENHYNSLVPIVIYLVLSIILVIFMFFRYPTDNIFQTILLIVGILILTGAIFMWYLFVHGNRAAAIATGTVFIIINVLIVVLVLEQRYQNVYEAHPFMIRP